MTAPRRALIVVDAQSEYFEGQLQIQYPSRDESRAQITQAIDKAEQAGIPVVVFQHEAPQGSPVFASGSPTFDLDPEISVRASQAKKRFVKHFSSIFADTELEAWLREQEIDTITIVGYMINNCILASAAAAEPLGFTVEVISDATGAIDIANDAGVALGQNAHPMLLAILHSNWAAVGTTEKWANAVDAGEKLAQSNLVESAARGRSWVG